MGSVLDNPMTVLNIGEELSPMAENETSSSITNFCQFPAIAASRPLVYLKRTWTHYFRSGTLGEQDLVLPVSVSDNPVAVLNFNVKDQLPPETNNLTSSATNVYRFLFLSPKRAIDSVCRVWTHCFPRRTLGEEGTITMIPGSAFNFVIIGLFSFTAIKSQGETKFPFHSNPNAITVAITSLIIYGLASATENLISASRLGPNSVYASIARLARKLCLCILKYHNHQELKAAILIIRSTTMPLLVSRDLGKDGYQSFGSQMARREDEYFLARRVADRGNDMRVLYSRARGKDQSSTHRIAARGSDRVDSDPWEFEINRLRRRVRDLELQHKIRRLKQRIQDLEASLTWKESEPEVHVGDELIGDDECPSNGDFIYDSPPMYDEYEDEEWYYLTNGGVIERFEEHVSYTISSCMFYKVLNEDLVVNDGHAGCSMTHDDQNDYSILITSTTNSTFMEGLTKFVSEFDIKAEEINAKDFCINNKIIMHAINLLGDFHQMG